MRCVTSSDPSGKQQELLQGIAVDQNCTLQHTIAKPANHASSNFLPAQDNTDNKPGKIRKAKNKWAAVPCRLLHSSLVPLIPSTPPWPELFHDVKSGIARPVHR
jgi:hypothetical protein